MSRARLEREVLELWMTTRIPLTLDHLVVCTKLPRKKVERWLGELAAEGVFDMDVSAEGRVTWTVPGADRATFGPATVAEWHGMARAREAVRKSKRRLPAVADLSLRSLRTPKGEDKKSPLLSGLLSFVFGPLGWLYAGPLGDAIPASALYLLVMALLPKLLLFPLMGIALPASGLIGLLYALRYNQAGRPIPLLGEDEPGKG